uniref:Uncharacterized protein n=1 Tax=Oryza meridionalis TaxID=40149 RepID=A0A0E0F8I0_9ORYZ
MALHSGDDLDPFTQVVHDIANDLTLPRTKSVGVPSAPTYTLKSLSICIVTNLTFVKGQIVALQSGFSLDDWIILVGSEQNPSRQPPPTATPTLLSTSPLLVLAS